VVALSLGVRARWSRLLAKGADLPQRPKSVDKRTSGPLLSLSGYSLKLVKFDLIAALTLLAIAVPEQLATARLAGMPVITGFYAFIAGTAFFALLGSNPQMSVGADSTIAPLFAVAIAHLATTSNASYVDLIGILAVCVGVIVMLVGLLKMGWLAEFLSKPIITGFMGGVAIIIVIHQLPDIFGLASVSGSNIHRVVVVVSHLSSTKVWPLVIAVGVFCIVIVSEHIDRRIPAGLIGVVASTVLVGLGRLTHHGVDVLGSVSHGLPRFGLHGLSVTTLEHVLPVALVVALVVISQSAATSRAFADAGHYGVDIGRDFVGVGAGSIVAGLAGSFPVDASPARTSAVASSGGKTQMTGLIAAACLVALVPLVGLLKYLPLSALAAILVYIATRIFHLKDFRAIAHFDLFELALALITLAAVAFVGVEQGIAVAIALAVVDRTRLSIQPRLQLLGRVQGTTSWVPIDHGEQKDHHDPNDYGELERNVPGVLVAMFATSLWYANASHFRAQVMSAIAERGEDLSAVVLDVVGMSDLDFTGAATLRQVIEDLKAKHIVFALARPGRRVRIGLERADLLTQLGEDHLYISVDAAVEAFTPVHPVNGPDTAKSTGVEKSS
jgi:MFS superfamily sulfate permease-like transporter